MDSQEIKESFKELDDRVKRLEYNEIKVNDKIITLCDKLDQVLNVGKWLIGLLITGFSTAFFSLIIYIIESHIK